MENRQNIILAEIREAIAALSSKVDELERLMNEGAPEVEGMPVSAVSDPVSPVISVDDGFDLGIELVDFASEVSPAPVEVLENPEEVASGEVAETPVEAPAEAPAEAPEAAPEETVVAIEDIPVEEAAAPEEIAPEVAPEEIAEEAAPVEEAPVEESMEEAAAPEEDVPAVGDLAEEESVFTEEPIFAEEADLPAEPALAEEPVLEAPADEPVAADEPVFEAPAEEPAFEAPAEEPVPEEPQSNVSEEDKQKYQVISEFDLDAMPEPLPEEKPAAYPFQEPAPTPEAPPEPISINDLEMRRLRPAVNDVMTGTYAWMTDKPAKKVNNVLCAVSLNDRKQITDELFGGNSILYMNTMTLMNKMTSLDEVVSYVSENFVSWDLNSKPVYIFMMAVRRRLG